MRLSDVISKEACNKGRQFELDLLKFILIIRLAPVHVFIDSAQPGALDVLGIPYFYDSVLGGVIGPTRFMILMGVGLGYSRHGSAKEVFRRGIKIGIIGFLLNVFRFLIPSLVGFGITGDAERYLEPLPFLFFGNDILQFASLAMMLMALFLHFKLTPEKIFGVSLLMSLAGNFVRNVDFHSIPLNIIFGHFIGVEDKSEETFIFSDFPLIIWFLFYAFGYFLGKYYTHLKDKNKFYAIVSPICIIVSVVFIIWEIHGGFGMMMGEGVNVFYHMTTPEAFVCIMAFLGLLGIYNFISPYIPEKLHKPIEAVSRNVNSIYCIHWVLVWWTVDLAVYCIKGDTYLKYSYAFLIGYAITVVSIILAHFWSKFKAERKAAYEKKK